MPPMPTTALPSTTVPLTTEAASSSVSTLGRVSLTARVMLGMFSTRVVLRAAYRRLLGRRQR